MIGAAEKVYQTSITAVPPGKTAEPAPLKELPPSLHRRPLTPKCEPERAPNNTPLSPHVTVAEVDAVGHFHRTTAGNAEAVRIEHVTRTDCPAGRRVAEIQPFGNVAIGEYARCRQRESDW